jgi:hypothetical protein
MCDVWVTWWTEVGQTRALAAAAAAAAALANATNSSTNGSTNGSFSGSGEDRSGSGVLTVGGGSGDSDGGVNAGWWC